MCFKHIAIASAFALAATPATAEALHDLSATSVAQAEGEPARTAPTQIQNIQRLLKLLADRYPKKYGSVDPGRVDGSFGAETKDAIRNFQKISGSKSGAQNGEQLVADILATLAQMSATPAADAGTYSAPKAEVPTPTIPAPQIAAAPPAEAPKIQVPKVEAPEAKAPEPVIEKPAAPAVVAATAPTAAPKTAKPKAAPAQVAAKGQRVFFVQAASLKSLESAKREWRRIFDENRAALTGEQVYFERANVGDRGLFFRILIGPMNERDAAKTLCSFLQQNDQTCVVTSRDPAELQKTAHQASPAVKVIPETSTTPDRNSPSTPAEPGVEAHAGPKASAADHAVPSVETQKPAPDGAESAASPANDPNQNAQQGPIAAEPAVPAVGEPAAEPKEPGPQSPSTGADTTATATAGSDASAAPSPGKAEAQAAATAPAPEPPPVSDPAPQAADRAASQAGPLEPKPAAGSGPTDSHPNATMDATQAVIAKLSQQPGKVAGVAAALAIAAGVAVYGWRRRNRRLSLSQLFQSTSLPFSRAPSESAGPMDDIETDFGSDSLQQSRLARDAFLRDTLGTEDSDESPARSDDAAMRINSSLKALLVKEPAQYKSIFLNWIFLAKVGAALNNKEIAFEQLNDPISREFDLLQTYFKIHLLELDDRHRIRQELPGLFYCLQLTQMKKRQNSAKFSAA